MKQYSRVCERVDLDAIFYNFQMMKANIKDGVQMIAVIKTDGYGHGAVQIARLLEPVDYIWGYAVATLDEAVVLRKHEIKKPILVLGCIFPDQWEAMIENEVRMTTYTVEMAKGVSDLAIKMGKDAYIHIKLDTGMSRLGFQIHEDSVDAAYVPPYGSGATLYVRPYMFGSSPVIGVKPAEEYQFRVFATPVGPYFKGGAKPITIKVSDFDRAAPHGTGHVKAGLNYAMSLHAIVTAHGEGYDENMYLDAAT